MLQLLLLLLTMINLHREDSGASPLIHQPALSILSQQRCLQQIANNTNSLSHEGLQIGVGENLAGGFTNPDNVFSAWRASPGHNDNMLYPNYQVTGLALCHGGFYGTYWVNNFALTPVLVKQAWLGVIREQE